MSTIVWLKKKLHLRLNREETIADTPRTGRTVDLTKRFWGHSMEAVGGHRFAVWCSPALRQGDLVRTERGEFLAVEVERCGDPPDMTFASFLKVEAS